MKIILEIMRDSHNTIPNAEVEIFFHRSSSHARIVVTDNDRQIYVDKDDLIRAVELLKLAS